MRISFEFSTDDGPPEPLDPLGKILIIGSDGRRITDECTFADSWFLSLIDIVDRLQAGETSFNTDLQVESDFLRIKTTSNGIILGYQDQETAFPSAYTFSTVLAAAIDETIIELESAQGQDLGDQWRYIRQAASRILTCEKKEQQERHEVTQESKLNTLDLCEGSVRNNFNPDSDLGSLRLKLRTQILHRIALRLMAGAAAVLAYFVSQQPLSISMVITLAILVSFVYVMLDHSARIILFRDKGVQLRGLFGWRIIRLSSSAILRRNRKRWAVFDPPHRTARFVIYPEFFLNSTDVERLKRILPEEPSS